MPTWIGCFQWCQRVCLLTCLFLVQHLSVLLVQCLLIFANHNHDEDGGVRLCRVHIPSSHPPRRAVHTTCLRTSSLKSTRSDNPGTALPRSPKPRLSVRANMMCVFPPSALECRGAQTVSNAVLVRGPQGRQATIRPVAAASSIVGEDSTTNRVWVAATPCRARRQNHLISVKKRISDTRHPRLLELKLGDTRPWLVRRPG
jgi:hypothetical protein